ncbi:MAG: D-alanyl-D-alanine carboxypeptidase [Deltaproteobacteria bacterium]|nr:D-alanyl-D-alanine carboxypeptidase [Deltaproteobacteria bacterium]
MVLIRFFLMLFAMLPLVAGATDAANSPDGSEACQAELLVEPATNTIFFEKNADEPLPPASMVKLMTAYVVLKQVEDELVDLNDTVTTSAAASKIGGSQVYLKQGEQFSVQEMLEAILVQSANDAAYALAEHIGGSSGGFVEMMRADAKALEMNSSDFQTPHGLPPAKDQSPDLVSARDFAKLSTVLLHKFPQILQYTAMSEKGFRGDTFMMRNHNHLVRSYPGCDGLKTGFYSKAGFCVAVTAQKNNLRMLAILMGCKSRRERDQEAARLLSLGFSKYRPLKLIAKDAPAGQMLKIKNGVEKEVMPLALESLSGMVPIGSEKMIERKYNLCEPPQAPVKAGTPCGSMSFYVGDRKIGEVALFIPNDIAKLGLMGRILRIF